MKSTRPRWRRIERLGVTHVDGLQMKDVEG